MSNPTAFSSVQFHAGSELLAGLVATEKKDQKPSLLFLHGAGKSDMSRTTYLAERLLTKGITSFSFDFSGHGKSTGTLQSSNLQKRVKEAVTAFNYLENGNPVSVCGSSMGGFVALKLLQKVTHIENLFLFCPAVYDRMAYEIPFGDGFSKILQAKDSWRNTDVLEDLAEFRGKLMLFIGEDDEVIPEGVIRLIDENSRSVRQKQIIRFPGCPHRIHEWLAARPKRADEVANRIISFLSSTR